MLPVANRLKKVRDFNLVLKYGRWTKGDFLDVKILFLPKNKDFFPKKVNPVLFAEQLLVAFSVGVKISKKATERNRIKRQLREIVRICIKKNVLQKRNYILIVAKPGVRTKKYAEIKQELDGLLRRAGVLAAAL